MPENTQEIKRGPHTVVFISPAKRLPRHLRKILGHLVDLPLVESVWPADPPEQLDAFLDDMDALGFAVWRTPSVVYVFAGE